MTDLATLTVRLEAETSQYQQQLAAATKQLQAFQSSVADFAEDLAKKFAAAFTIDAIAEFIENSIEGAAALERLSQEVGVAVQQLSALAAVFAQSGVGQDQMATSLKKLNQSISDAAGNATSKAAFAFQALGLSVTNSNGSLKTAGELLPQIADAYQHLADGPNKVAINTDLLGRSAQALIPTLNQGGAALDALEQSAIDSGAALSGDLAKAAEDLENKFIALKQSFTGTLSTEALEAVLPTLNAFADGLGAIAKEGSSTNAIMQILAAVLGVLGAAVLEIDGEFKQLGSAIDGVENAVSAAAGGLKKALGDALSLDGSSLIKDLASTGTQVGTILDDQSDEAQRIYNTKNAAIENILNAGGKKQIDLSAEIASTISHNLSHAFDGLEDNAGISPALLQAQSEAQKKVSEFSDSIKAQASSFNLGSSASINFKLTTGAMGDAIALAKKNVDDMTSGVLPFNQALSDSANKTLAAAGAARVYAAQLQQKQDTKEIDDYTDKLQEQVIKFGQSDVAAIDFAATTGKLGDALSRTGAAGDAARAHIHDLAVELTDDKDKTALFAVDQQILTMSGHLQEAAVAAFNFQNKLLIKNVAATGNTGDQAKLDFLKQQQVAQAAFTEQVNLSTRAQLDYGSAEATVQLAQSSGDLTDLQAMALLDTARKAEIDQLTQIYESEKAIADASGDPKLIQNAQALQNQIKQLQQSTDQLAKTIRNDLEDDAANSFLEIETGAKSAKAAVEDFFKDLEKQLLQMANKDIAQQIFGTGGIGGGAAGGLASLFGGGGGASGGSGLGSLLSSLGGKLGFGANSTANPEFGAGGADITDASVFGGGGGVADSTIGDLGAAEDLGFAGGGHVKAGQHTIIGEHGAEEFIPDTNGTVVPNSKMSQGHTIVNNFTIQSQNGQISRPSQMQTAAAVGRSVVAASARNNR